MRGVPTQLHTPKTPFCNTGNGITFQCSVEERCSLLSGSRNRPAYSHALAQNTYPPTAFRLQGGRLHFHRDAPGGASIPRSDRCVRAAAEDMGGECGGGVGCGGVALTHHTQLIRLFRPEQLSPPAEKTEKRASPPPSTPVPLARTFKSTQFSSAYFSPLRIISIQPLCSTPAPATAAV